MAKKTVTIKAEIYKPKDFVEFMADDNVLDSQKCEIAKKFVDDYEASLKRDNEFKIKFPILEDY